MYHSVYVYSNVTVYHALQYYTVEFRFILTN